MYKKIAILLLITYVASAKQVSTPEVLEDKIDDIIAEIQKVVDGAIDKAREDLTNFELFVDQTGLKVTEKVTDSLHVLEKFFRNYIDDLSDVAKRAGVDVKVCLGEDVDELLGLPAMAVNDVFWCKQNYIFPAFDSLYSALNKAEELADEILSIKKEIDNCKKSPHRRICLAELVIKIESAKHRIPREIANNIITVIDLIKNTIPNLEKCGSNAVNVCDNNGRKLLKNISQCIAHKIIHK